MAGVRSIDPALEAKASLTRHNVDINAATAPQIGHESGAIAAIPRDFQPVPEKKFFVFLPHTKKMRHTPEEQSVTEDSAQSRATSRLAARVDDYGPHALVDEATRAGCIGWVILYKGIARNIPRGASAG